MINLLVMGSTAVSTFIILSIFSSESMDEPPTRRFKIRMALLLLVIIGCLLSGVIMLNLTVALIGVGGFSGAVIGLLVEMVLYFHRRGRPSQGASRR